MVSSGAQHKVLMKVVLIGDVNVGKTTLINSYTNATQTAKSGPSLGPDIKTKDIEEADGTQVKISLWDTAGQE